MEDYIDYQRKFYFDKQIGNLRVFQSTDDTVVTSITLGSNKVKVYKNDCVFILDPDKEVIIKYTLNKYGNIDETSAYKFNLQNKSLKKWGRSSSQDLNLNLYDFYSEDKNDKDMPEEHITYYVKYSPEELRAFVNSIFQNLKKPCFEMTTIIRFFLDGVTTENNERIKENIYKYVLLPNKKYEDFRMPEDSERKNIKKVETENRIIYEDHTKYYPPTEYSLDARKRYKENIDCHMIHLNTPFYDVYLKEKNKTTIKSLLGKSKNLTFKEFLLKNQDKKFRYRRNMSEEYAFRTFNEEYEEHKQVLNPDLSVRIRPKAEYIEYLEKMETYDELKQWIAKVKEKKPRGYGLTIGSHVEPIFKRYFSVNARGYYFYKDIVIMFSVDGYGKDFIYEFKTCISRKVEHNLNFAKEQANLYAYLAEKKKIIIEIFSYEDDKIFLYEFNVDKDSAKEKLERFYLNYKEYFQIISNSTQKSLTKFIK